MTCRYRGGFFCEGELPTKHLLYMFQKSKDVKVTSEGYRKWQDQIVKAEDCCFGELDSILASDIVLHYSNEVFFNLTFHGCLVILVPRLLETDTRDPIYRCAEPLPQVKLRWSCFVCFIILCILRSRLKYLSLSTQDKIFVISVPQGCISKRGVITGPLVLSDLRK